MWRNKKAMRWWLKPEHLLIGACTINLPLPSLCQVTNYPIYQAALPNWADTGWEFNAHTGVPNHGWWLLTNRALPRCPNSPEFWGGGSGSLTRGYLCSPALGPHQKHNFFPGKTFQGCQTLAGRASSDLWGDLQSTAPCCLHPIKSFCCISDGWKMHPSVIFFFFFH